MYPNIAISNKVYPEHLTEKFCEIYKGIYEQRKTYAKNTPENAMLKLSLNGTYGKSNDKFSVFYDPKFTRMLSFFLLGQKPGSFLIITIRGIIKPFRQFHESVVTHTRQNKLRTIS